MVISGDVGKCVDYARPCHINTPGAMGSNLAIAMDV